MMSSLGIHLRAIGLFISIILIITSPLIISKLIGIKAVMGILFFGSVSFMYLCCYKIVKYTNKETR